MIAFHDLTDSAADIDTLTRWYEACYVAEFPNASERESLPNMIEYLRRRASGWYGRNNYHILLAMADGQPVGAAVVDYLAEPNVGVIEFLLTAPAARRSGIGRAVLDRTERLLDQDARRSNGRPLSAVIAEMNDPRAPSDVRDNIDPAQRALIWHRWGYAGLDFPYVQPALSDDQQPVTNLMIIAKGLEPGWCDGFPAPLVRSAVHEYIRWAMRIDRPDGNPEFRRMADHLDRCATVGTIPLDRYVGRDPARPLDIQEIAGPTDPDFGPTMALYRQIFDGTDLAVPEDDFRRALADDCYHLWAVRGERRDEPVNGLVSLFSLPSAGYVGFLALTGVLHRTGRLRPLIARIEERMLADRTTMHGWYVEVGPGTDPAAFRAIGFQELAVAYAQPAAARPAARLMFRPFGRSYGRIELRASDALAALADILAVVYRVAAPREHVTYRTIAAQLDAAGPLVTFR